MVNTFLLLVVWSFYYLSISDLLDMQLLTLFYHSNVEMFLFSGHFCNFSYLFKHLILFAKKNMFS